MWFFNWPVFITHHGNGTIIDLSKKGIKIRLSLNFSITSMDLINTPSRTRSKRVYDHSISGSPKNVENSAVKSSTRRKLNFDAVAYEVSILNLFLDITSSEKGCRNISLIYSNSRKTVSYEEQRMSMEKYPNNFLPKFSRVCVANWPRYLYIYLK